MILSVVVEVVEWRIPRHGGWGPIRARGYPVGVQERAPRRRLKLRLLNWERVDTSWRLARHEMADE
jgi:hypothetical protein